MGKWMVLSGGGSKGAFELGVVSKLTEMEPDLEYEGFAGISVGALLAAHLSQAELSESIKMAEDVWLNKIKGSSSIWKHRFLKWIGIVGSVNLALLASTIIAFFLNSPMWLTATLGVLWFASFSLFYCVLKTTKSIYNSSPLKDLVHSHYDPEKTKKAGKKVIVGAVSWRDGNYEFVDHNNENIKDWILASSAFPMFLDNVKIGEKWYTDGGVRETAPLKNAIDEGATEIDVILASPLSMGEDKAMPELLGQLMRTLEILANEVMRTDLIEIAQLNPDIKVRVFMPIKPLVKNSLDFNPKNIKEMYEEGRKAALKPMTLKEVNDSISGF